MRYRSQRPAHLKQSKGAYVVNWIERHCVYTQGKWVGQPAVLQSWQKSFIMALFAIDPETGRRWYRWALLGVPKKAGKTELAAWLALYFLIGDGEPSPVIACAASADHQADLVFGAASRCAEWSPTLSKVCEVYDRHIEVPSMPGAKLVRVTAGTGTNDGPSWHAVICDELHEWGEPRGRKLWEILTNGIGAREQPVILQITTAGYDKDTVCGEQYDLGMKLVHDHTIDERYLFEWWEPDEPGADHTDPEVWKQAQPSWGVTIPTPVLYLKDQLVKKTESTFRRYFLNQWVEAEDLWLPSGSWASNFRPDLELDTDLPLYVGIDGALKKDSFAVVAYQPQEPDPVVRAIMEEVYAELEIELPDRWSIDVIRAWIWERPDPRDNSWKLNLKEPQNKVRELRETFHAPALEGIMGPAVGYDPWALELFAQELEDEGVNMIEVPQSDARMCPASETLYTKIVTQGVAHDGDPQYERQIMGAVQKIKDRGWRLTRPANSKKKVDAAIATAIASYLAHLPDDGGVAEPNIW